MAFLRSPAGVPALCVTAVLVAAGCVGGEPGGGASATSPAVTAGDRQIPLSVVENDGQVIVFVPVTIQGEGPLRFVLDTGASASAVDDDVVRELGLPRTGERQAVTGVTGTRTVPVVKVSEWKAGEVELDPAEVTVIDVDTPRGAPGIQGLLGSDVLSAFGNVTVDYEHETLRFPAR
ncbi:MULTISPECIES: retropepsin-like aspartic protease [unclassified Streptomyces]|uniref:retropepsin-like aspartic protease n=1 Tax=unclassified Streptomyces TaxID=2593676 RepID=UPI003D75B165